MTSRRFNTQAFTLVELLVVVSIIGVLASVLLPSMHSARSSARAVVCKSNLRQLAIANTIYLREYGCFPPMRLKTVGSATFVNRYGREKPRWQWFLQEEVQPVIDPTGFELPFGDGSISADGRSGLEMTSSYFKDPAFSGAYAADIRNGAYGFNYQYLGNSRGPQADVHWNWPVGESTLRAPASTVLFADSRGGAEPHGEHSYTLDPPKNGFNAAGVLMAFGPHAPDDTTLGHSPVDMRHRGTGNVAFVDSHVASLMLVELGYVVSGDSAVAVDPTVTPDSAANNRLWTGSGRDQEPPPTE